MIQNLWKHEVYDMAEYLSNNEYSLTSDKIEKRDAGGILSNTIQSMATDGLGVTNRGDLGQILPNWTGKSREGYIKVDSILEDYLSLDKTNKMTSFYASDEIESVIKRHHSSEYKRLLPINIPRTTF